ncbi:MAG: acyltransferase family protein [Acidimicrobiales bacterium]|nr:acyltransferase family protein [Acidimicrobiales bacterium]
MTQTTAAPPPGSPSDEPDDVVGEVDPQVTVIADDAPPVDRRPRIPHAPGLDGLRGLAVAAVVVFHAAPAGWLPGGFLGVSLFFTLSGYLITSLVLVEVRHDRRVGMAAFWARRIRRLVPALVVTTLGVVVASKLTELGGDLRADLVGGLTYSANWVQIARDQSYAELFAAPSPLTHLWSLAIEEQFYVVLPIVAALLAWRAPWLVRNRLAIGAALVVVVGVAFCQIVDDADLAYYATISRAPEIAIGMLLACRTRAGAGRAPRWQTGAAVVALAITVAAWRLAHVTDGWIVGGGLAAFAVASAVLVRVAARPGPFARALSFAPLRWLGLISYGLYLYHWPVVVLLDLPRVDWAPVPLFGARVAASVAVAVVSYRLIEQPLRRGRPLVPHGAVIGAGLAALAVCLVIVLVAVPPAADAPEAVDAAAVVSSTPTEAAGTVGPPTVVLLGDSLPAFMLRDGAMSLDPDEITLVNGTLPACDGAAGTPPARSRTGDLVPVPEACTGWPSQYPQYFGAQADLAILMVGGHAVLDRQLDGAFHGPCEAVAADFYRNDIEERLRWLQERADAVVLALPAWGDRMSIWINPPDHLDRMDCVRQTLSEAAEATGTPTIDFGRYLCPDGRDRCRPVRTRDGVHLDENAAPTALKWVLANAMAEGGIEPFEPPTTTTEATTSPSSGSGSGSGSDAPTTAGG